MDEYINKNVLYKIITQLEELARNRYLDAPSLYYPMYMTQLNERAYFKQIITDFPTADVEPVRHGRWENGNPICPVCVWRRQIQRSRRRYLVRLETSFLS